MFFRISSGVPSASVRPWSSTWIRSQTSRISVTLWSIRSTPAPCSSRTERTTAARSGTSASVRPAAGSSISTKRGSVASARATPSLRSSPCGSAEALSSARAAEAERAEQAPRALAGVARRRADAERSDLDVLAHGQALEGVPVLERAREARTPEPLRRPPGHVAFLELDAAGRREVEARDHVHERRLAGTVRPDEADHLAARKLEVDLRESLHAFERARDADRPEQSGRSASLWILLCHAPR